MSKKFDKSRKPPTGKIAGRLSSATTEKAKDKTMAEQMEDLDLAALAQALGPYLTEIMQEFYSSLLEGDTITEIIYNYIFNFFNEYYYSLSVFPGDGIEIPEYMTVAVDLTTDTPYPGLDFTDDDADGIGELHVKPNNAKGIKVTTDGVEVMDGDGIVNDATHGVGIDLDDPACLELTGASPDKKLKVKVKADSGLSCSADGLYAVAGNYIKIDADGISVIPCGEGGLFVCCE